MKLTSLFYEWHADLATCVFLALIVSIFYSLGGFRFKKSIYCFFSALFLFILVTFSPLHYLGMHYYFSAHMIAHIIILLVCGPLIIVSIPISSPTFFFKKIEALSSLLFKYPLISWITGAVVMWLWHIPYVFDASFAHMHESLNFMPLMHSASMLLAGMIFSWPLVGPFLKYRIHPLVGIVYLFTACISCSLLGLLITFAPPNTYHHYVNTSSSIGMSVNPLGISAIEDQKAAGLIMWVPCCLIYLTGCIYLLQQWFAVDDTISLNQSN
ncbi:MAG: cytochrome c oxidase assembly protein [Bacteroidia bacterium]